MLENQEIQRSTDEFYNNSSILHTNNNIVSIYNNIDIINCVVPIICSYNLLPFPHFSWYSHEINCPDSSTKLQLSTKALQLALK